MPILTFPKSTLGAVIDVTLWPSKGGHALISRAGRPVAAPVVIKMLVDTGADRTAVDENKILHWGLPVSGMGWGRSMGGVKPLRSYELSIRLGGKNSQIPWEIEPLMVDARPAPYGNLPYAGVLGRDVLDRSMFVYNGQMHECTLAY